MIDPDNFLKYDKGRKDTRVGPVRVQTELAQAISLLADGNETRWIRQVLISHVRKKIKEKDPRLHDLTIPIRNEGSDQ